jgi:hypothetical protein
MIHRRGRNWKRQKLLPLTTPVRGSKGLLRRVGVKGEERMKMENTGLEMGSRSLWHMF